MGWEELNSFSAEWRKQEYIDHAYIYTRNTRVGTTIDQMTALLPCRTWNISKTIKLRTKNIQNEKTYISVCVCVALLLFKSYRVHDSVDPTPIEKNNTRKYYVLPLKESSLKMYTYESIFVRVKVLWKWASEASMLLPCEMIANNILYGVLIPLINIVGQRVAFFFPLPFFVFSPFHSSDYSNWIESRENSSNFTREF